MKRREILRAGAALLGTTAFVGVAGAQNKTVTPNTEEKFSLKNTQSEIDKFGLDNDDLIFIFADLHPDLISSSNTMSAASLSANAGGLAKISRAISAPALFLTVPRNGKPGELISELKPYANSSNTLYRLNADPFQVPEIVNAINQSIKT